MVTVVRPPRDQIARMANNDQRLIIAIEALFDAAIVDVPEDVQSLQNTDLELAIRSASQRRVSQTVQADYIDLSRAPHATLPRRMQWNEDDGTVDIGMDGGVVLQVGQEMHYYAKNTSGATIQNGASVMATGTVGASGKLTIANAVADGSVEGRYMLGIATQEIADSAFGRVTSFGLVRGVDTSAFADGDLLYFDPATPGGLTDVRPSAPNLRTAQAIVINAGSGGSGSLFVRMHPEHTIADMGDVSLTGLADGDLLQWNAGAGYWEPYPIPTGASGSFTAASGETVTVTNGIITGIV